MDVLEEQSREEGDPGLELEEDIFFGVIGRRIGRFLL